MQILEVFPIGPTKYQAKAFPNSPQTSSAEAQRLQRILRKTHFVLWEVRTKVGIIRKYVGITDAWSKLLVVGTHATSCR